MKDSKVISKYYGDLDNVFHKITNALNNYEKSQTLNRVKFFIHF